MYHSTSKPFAIWVIAVSAIIGISGRSPAVPGQSDIYVSPLNRKLLGEYSIKTAMEYVPSLMLWKNISDLSEEEYNEKLPATIKIVVLDRTNQSIKYKATFTMNPPAKAVAGGKVDYTWDMSKKNFTTKPFFVRYYIVGQNYERVPGAASASVQVAGHVISPDYFWHTQMEVKNFKGSFNNGILAMSWECQNGHKYKYVLKHK